jgi:hypothetical protein
VREVSHDKQGDHSCKKRKQHAFVMEEFHLSILCPVNQNTESRNQNRIGWIKAAAAFYT